MTDAIHGLDDKPSKGWFQGVSGVPGDGPFIVLKLEVLGDHISRVEWECNGCPPAQLACCSLATFLKGRTLDQASKIEGHDVDVLCGGLPDGKGQYADMGAYALQAALNLARSN